MKDNDFSPYWSETDRDGRKIRFPGSEDYQQSDNYQIKSDPSFPANREALRGLSSTGNDHRRRKHLKSQLKWNFTYDQHTCFPVSFLHLFSKLGR